MSFSIRSIPPAGGGGCRSRLLDFGFDADDGFGAVGEADARAAVGGREDVGFGDQGPELGGGSAVWADGG